jgi:hypothetical protein
LRKLLLGWWGILSFSLFSLSIIFVTAKTGGVWKCKLQSRSITHSDDKTWHFQMCFYTVLSSDSSFPLSIPNSESIHVYTNKQVTIVWTIFIFSHCNHNFHFYLYTHCSIFVLLLLDMRSTIYEVHTYHILYSMAYIYRVVQCISSVHNWAFTMYILIMCLVLPSIHTMH